MKKIFIFIAAVALVGWGRNELFAQYARRDVCPPVAGTTDLDPSTPLGKVQEIAKRLDEIELATTKIADRLDNKTHPDYKPSLDKILEAANASRSEVARLGSIANDVGYIAQAVETIERNTAATSETARNVANIAAILRHVATTEQLDAAIAKAIADKDVAVKAALEEQKVAFLQALEESRATAKNDAEKLKKKLETASNIIILLGVLIAASLIVNVYKWLREQSREQIQAFIATANNGKSSAK